MLKGIGVTQVGDARGSGGSKAQHDGRVGYCLMLLWFGLVLRSLVYHGLVWVGLTRFGLVYQHG